MNVEGEIIQMPCLDVQRFRKENRLKEGPASDEEDHAQGTIEQIANIEPGSWNKRWKNAYAHDFPGDGSSVTHKDNLDKFKLFLQNRLGAWQTSVEQIFGTQTWESRPRRTRLSSEFRGRALTNRLAPEHRKESRHGPTTKLSGRQHTMERAYRDWQLP